MAGEGWRRRPLAVWEEGLLAAGLTAGPTISGGSGCSEALQSCPQLSQEARLLDHGLDSRSMTQEGGVTGGIFFLEAVGTKHAVPSST